MSRILFQLTALAATLFIITILSMIAMMMGDPVAPINLWFNDHGATVLFIEVTAIVVFGLASMNADRRETLRAKPPTQAKSVPTTDPNDWHPIVMKLQIEIPDANEDDDWVSHREVSLVELRSDSGDVIQELLVAYNQSIALPSGEEFQVSAHYGKHNGLSWIMVKEDGEHKASIEAISNDPPPRLIFTTSGGAIVRLAIVA